MGRFLEGVHNRLVTACVYGEVAAKMRKDESLSFDRELDNPQIQQSAERRVQRVEDGVVNFASRIVTPFLELDRDLNRIIALDYAGTRAQLETHTFEPDEPTVEAYAQSSEVIDHARKWSSAIEAGVALGAVLALKSERARSVVKWGGLVVGGGLILRQAVRMYEDALPQDRSIDDY